MSNYFSEDVMKASDLKLADDMAKFREQLEDSPDQWFENPRGWLLRPSYKRAAQRRSSHGRASISDRLSLKKLTTGSAYKRRWFVLDTHHKVIRYFKNEMTRVESGWIDMMQIVDVKRSKIFDAPDWAIDLISEDKNYTVAAQSEDEMVRWAFAVRHMIDDLVLKKKVPARPSTKGYVLVAKDQDSVKGEESTAENQITSVGDRLADTSRWMRYDYTYQDPGPLMMNVMGTADLDKKGRVVSYWVIITSFASFPDGSKGASEATGVIKTKDYIVGVNGKDLTQMPFDEAMIAVRSASWPKTLHFLRDTNLDGKVVHAEHWAQVFYPSLLRARRRYIELTSETINFRKAAPGGSAVSQRDAFYSLKQMVYLRPVIDLNAADDFKYKLRIVCWPHAQVSIVNEKDDAIGESSVEVLELAFKEEIEMTEWTATLANPKKRAKDDNSVTGCEVPVAPIELIEKAVVERKSAQDMVLGVKSDVTGQFSLREFSISEGGHLVWMNGATNSQASPSNKVLQQISGKQRKIFIGDKDFCGLRSIQAVQFPAEDANGYPFQMLLKTDDQKLTLGMLDGATLMEWVQKIKTILEVSPPEKTAQLHIPSGITQAADMVVDDDDDDDDSESEAPKMGLGERVRSLSLIGAQAREFINFCLTDDLSQDYVQGWLYYKHNVQVNFGFKKLFTRYYFVLREYTLLYYKADVDVSQRGKVYGTIDLLTVIAIRESQDPLVTENALELATLNRTYLLVAEDEAQYLMWAEALGDTLEMRHTAVQNAPRVGTMLESPAEKLAEFKKTIAYSGALSMKGYNWLTGTSVWKPKYFVLTNQAMTYFDSADEMIDTPDPSKEISLAAIKLIETSKDRSCAPSCAFDVHAHVRKGGDQSGLKVFTFECQTAFLCKEWMTKMCETSGMLTLQPDATGKGFESVVNTDAKKQRDEQRRKSGASFVKVGNTLANEERASMGGDRPSIGSAGEPPAAPAVESSFSNFADDAPKPEPKPDPQAVKRNSLGGAGRGDGRNRGMGRGFTRLSQGSNTSTENGKM
jgi:hypothetical protein